LKNNKARAIRFSTLDELCRALSCQPGDILEFEDGIAAGGEEAWDGESRDSE
jgi:putative transcriptional regulator